MLLREAAPGDVATILRLVQALAEFQDLAHHAVATEADFTLALFGEPPCAQALLAETDAGAAVGFALWTFNFSSFTGRRGLFVETVFVTAEHRGRGLGRAIFRELAQRALAAGCARMEWSVLDSNAAAIAFYRGLGAEPKDQWTTQRLSGNALAALAA